MKLGSVLVTATADDLNKVSDIHDDGHTLIGKGKDTMKTYLEISRRRRRLLSVTVTMFTPIPEIKKILFTLIRLRSLQVTCSTSWTCTATNTNLSLPTSQRMVTDTTYQRRDADRRVSPKQLKSELPHVLTDGDSIPKSRSAHIQAIKEVRKQIMKQQLLEIRKEHQTFKAYLAQTMGAK